MAKSSSRFATQAVTTAVLTSGGLDSAVLVAELANADQPVQPIYMRCGLSWEAVELHYLRLYLEALGRPALRPLVILEMPVGDLYGDHWSITGQAVPDAATPDDAVYLPGRNVLLLAKAMIWCHLHKVRKLALGILAANPFPDATPGFISEFQSAVNRAVGGDIEIQRPYANLTKVQVLSRVHGLPLEHTFSCIRPMGTDHCGACNKCAERRRAFHEAGLPDATTYATGE